MAKVLTTNGSAQTAGNWTPSGKPTVSDDLEIPEGKKCEIPTITKCRSLYVAKKAEISGIGALEVTPNAEPENSFGKNWALRIETEAVVSGYTGSFTFVGSFATTEQKISVDKSLTLKSAFNFSTASAKYKLEEELKTTEFIGFAEKATLDTNGKKVTCQAFRGFSVAKTKITLGVSEIVLTGGFELGVAWEAPKGAEATLSAASAKIVLQDSTTGSIFNGNGQSYGTVVMESRKGEFKGSNTIGTLEMKTAGLEATKFEEGTTQTVTTFTANGKAGSLVKMESTVVAKKWKLSKAATTVSLDYLELKDSGVNVTPNWYAGTHSTNVSGNEGWKFESLFVEFLRSLSATQGQTPALPKQANLIKPLTQGTNLGMAKLPQRTLSFAQAQALVLGNRAIGKPYPLVQNVAPVAAKLAFKVISVEQTSSVAERAQVGKPLAVSQPQSVGFGRAFSLALKLTQEQIAKAIKALPRFLTIEQPSQVTGLGKSVLSKLSTAQNQNLFYSVAGKKSLSTAQNQNVGQLKEVPKAFSVSQGQTASLSKLQLRILRVIQEVIASPSRKALSKTVALVQVASPAVLKRVSTKTLSVIQGTIVFLQEPQHVEIRILSVVQPTVASLNKFTQKVILVTQPVTLAVKKFIPKEIKVAQANEANVRKSLPRTLLVSQPQIANMESRVLALFKIALTALQNIIPLSSKTLAKRMPLEQETVAKVNKGFAVSLKASVETIIEGTKTFLTRIFVVQNLTPEAGRSNIGRHPSAGAIIWILDEHKVIRVENTLHQYEGEIIKTPGQPDKLLFTLRKRGLEPAPPKKGSTRDPQWQP